MGTVPICYAARIASITMSDEIRDELPDDLNAVENAGPLQFPDNSRRRIPALIYWALAAACIVLYLVTRPGATLVNTGMLWAGIALALVGLLSFTSGWRMHVDEQDALAAAQQAAGFTAGHAAAQQVWRGLRSRPTWRILTYSNEMPPRRRALVLVDAIDGHVVEKIVEDTTADEREDLLADALDDDGYDDVDEVDDGDLVDGADRGVQ